ncbi:hypothetical protein BJ508DRAFT_309163 [Ascobolus immersus RN42]|uniref:Uncharacterized protein n=1 Tax=Ascobolus immersus RN42 TaxID=1160509 RepID=A0A3N4HXH3_ASCIM|nr:hypothetical protein BJ508DRAFT_309163 [Ascobolus immersus RN42]
MAENPSATAPAKPVDQLIESLGEDLQSTVNRIIQLVGPVLRAIEPPSEDSDSDTDTDSDTDSDSDTGASKTRGEALPDTSFFPPFIAHLFKSFGPKDAPYKNSELEDLRSRIMRLSKEITDQMYLEMMMRNSDNRGWETEVASWRLLVEDMRERDNKFKKKILKSLEVLTGEVKDLKIKTSENKCACDSESHRK